MIQITPIGSDNMMPFVPSKIDSEKVQYRGIAMDLRRPAHTKGKPYSISFSNLTAESTVMTREFSEQLETQKLYEIAQASRVTEIIRKEKVYFKNTYNQKVGQNADVTLSYVAKKLAELNFIDLSVEFTLLNTAIFYIVLKKNVVLLITIPLAVHENLDRMEVIYNLFIEEEEVVSDCKNLNNVIKGGKELTSQNIGFTTA